MDFAEDYRSWSQNEIQSAYWSPTQVAIHPVVMYYKNRGEKENIHQSFVLVSSESHHDATFIYTLIGKLVPLLKEIVIWKWFIIAQTHRQVNTGTKPFSKLSVTMRNISTAKHHRIIWKVITEKSHATKQLKTEGL